MKLFSSLVVAMIVTATNSLVADDSTAVQEAPFAGMDLTWINGQNRQSEFPLSVKDIGTGVIYLDTYYNYNFAKPIDNTQTISSTVGRTSEVSLNLASVGFELNYKNVIGRLWLQTGSMLHIVQELDGSVAHGRNTGTGNLKFIREAAAGYHFDAWHGLNIEMGIFMSYIGLESYVTQENWSYQRSLPCDMTPFYFQGARIQAYPTSNYKVELWVLNGWQTYNSFNTGLGLGNSNYWRPNEDLQLVANFYLGQDTRTSSTVRFHHDNSIVARYIKRKQSAGISQAAFSLNTHYGFQSGNGVTVADQHFIGSSLAHRVWFDHNRYGLTVRADVVTNPGGYLAFSPSPVTPNAYTEATSGQNQMSLNMAQFTTTFDIMPSDFVTFRLEYLHRASNIPYFAGQGGTTSPDGWIDTPTATWRPDLRTYEDRFTFALQVRM